MRSSRGITRRLAYLVMPVVFCCLGYLLIWAALQPVWDMGSAVVMALFAEDAPNFNSDITNIYDPNATKPPTSTEAKDDNTQREYISGRDVEFPNAGSQYGHMTCEEIGLDCPVYWYDSDDILLYGAGQSLISLPPGFGTAIILCGHNTTFFRCLEFIQPGNVIKFHTNYCDYEYTVTKVEVHNENELEQIMTEKAKDETHEELIMYTCYPFHAISGRKVDRLTVFADRTAGLDVKWKEGSV